MIDDRTGLLKTGLIGDFHLQQSEFSFHNGCNQLIQYSLCQILSL